jgi:uncharacterized membrane protein
MKEVLQRNIRTLTAREQRDQESAGIQERVITLVTRFAGSIGFVYAHLLIFGAWIAANSGVLGNEPWDPSFVGLASIASVEAIFLTSFVLITQNRMAAVADRRAELDVQISLLAEHELTEMMQLVTRISAHLGVETTPTEEEVKRDVDPGEVLDTIENREREQ